MGRIGAIGAEDQAGTARLQVLPVADEIQRRSSGLTIYAATVRDAPIGRAAAWLLQHMREHWSQRM